MLLPNGQEMLFGAAVKSRWSQQTIGTDIRGAVAADSSNLGLFRVWTNATNPTAFWGSDLPLTAGAAAARAAFDPLTRRADGELRAERHAVHHGAAVSDGARRGRRRDPHQDGGIRHGAAHRDERRRCRRGAPTPSRRSVCRSAAGTARALVVTTTGHRLPLVQRHRHSARSRCGDARSGSR